MSVDPTTLGVGSMKPHNEYYFRNGDVLFYVENTVFRLHRHFFERESDYFRARLDPYTQSANGPLNEFTICDATSEEFAHLVWVWYNPRYSFSKQPKQKWLAILRLATLWQFNEIRKLAIRHLEKLKLDPIEKITMYREYSVDNHLLFPSYVSLCTKDSLPSPEEGKMLTLETVLRLACARERVLLRASEIGCKTPTIASAPEDIVKAIVAELFDLSLHSNDQNVGVQGQAINNAADEEVISVKQPDPKKKGKLNGVVSQESPQVSQNGAGASGGGKGKQRS